VSAPRVAVFGCGYMGSLHAAKVAALAAEGRVRFAGVADVDGSRAEAAGRLHGVRFETDFRALLGAADAAVVAVPTVHHFEVVHATLASDPSNQAFAPEPFSQFHQRSLYQSSRRLALQTFQQLRSRLKSLPAEVNCWRAKFSTAKGSCKEALDNLDAWKGANVPFYVCKVCGNTVAKIDFSKCPVCYEPKSEYIAIK
jgi:hypothetical protein